MNTDTPVCKCAPCTGAACTCGCQARAACPPTCACGCQQGKPCGCAGR